MALAKLIILIGVLVEVGFILAFEWRGLSVPSRMFVGAVFVIVSAQVYRLCLAFVRARDLKRQR